MNDYNYIDLTITVRLVRIAHLLSCTFDPGTSNFWCCVGEVDATAATSLARDFLGKEVTNQSRYAWLPLIPGCSVEILEIDAERKGTWKKHRLDLDAVKRGLSLMADPANKYTRHFGNWLSGKEYAETGDVFLQLAVLGKVVYG